MTDSVRILAAGDARIPSSLIARVIGETVRDPRARVRELTRGAHAEITGEELLAASKGIDALVTRSAPITEEFLEARPTLRLVAICGERPGDLDREAAARRDVRICHTPGCGTAAVAEHTLGLMLALLRHTVGGGGTDYEHAGRELEDLPVGVIGHGAAGGRVARLLCAFGARVLVYDPYARGEIHGLRVSSLDELLTRSRVITLHAADTPETRGLVGARELALLPPDAAVVHTAGSPQVDEEALSRALESGRVSGAALASDTAPPRLRALAGRRLLLAPGAADATRAAAEKAVRAAADEVARWLRGAPPAHALT
ncbi:NAD(P)-dependent oxidoreductase [Streptomyces sp. ZYX-F-203]